MSTSSVVTGDDAGEGEAIPLDSDEVDALGRSVLPFSGTASLFLKSDSVCLLLS